MAGTPLASGNLTKTGTASMAAVAASSTSFGTLTEVVGLANRKGQSVSELASWMTKLPQVLLNVEVADLDGLEPSPRVWEAVRAAEADLGKEGRVLVRASGTEPLVRVMVEGPTEQIARAHAERIAGVVRATLA